MKSAIFSLLPVSRGSTIASIRIGEWLSRFLEIPLYDDEDILAEGPLDNLFIINGSTLYCKYLEQLAECVRSAKNVIWVQNDYTLPPPRAESAAESPFRKAFAERKLVPHYWTTCEANSTMTPASGWVNWNSLAFRMDAPRSKLCNEKTIYYGAFRENRIESFHTMYDLAADLHLQISSTSKKFPDSLRIEPFRDNLYASLAEYGLGIYAQDKKSATGRHSPATRFYEMLSVGLPMAFLPDCVPTMKSYGYDVSPFVLTKDSLKRRHSWAAMQNEWVEDFETKIRMKVTDLYAKLDS